MFYQYRIDRLDRKIKVQEALVELLCKSEKQYANSYYTDRFHTAFCDLVNLKSKRSFLQRKLDNKNY